MTPNDHRVQCSKLPTWLNRVRLINAVRVITAWDQIEDRAPAGTQALCSGSRTHPASASTNCASAQHPGSLRPPQTRTPHPTRPQYGTGHRMPGLGPAALSGAALSAV